MQMDYIYKGGKLTDPNLKGRLCKAIRRLDGKCIRGKNGNMLVELDNGVQHIVVAKFLRKINQQKLTPIYKQLSIF